MGVGFTLVLKVPHGAEYNEAPMLAAQVQAGKLCLRCMSGCHRSWWWSIRWIRSGNTPGTWHMLTVYWDAMQMHGAMGYKPLV